MTAEQDDDTPLARAYRAMVVAEKDLKEACDRRWNTCLEYSRLVKELNKSDKD